MNGKQLQEALKAISSGTPSKKFPRFTWQRRQAELLERVGDHDLDEFLRWPMITEALFVGDTKWVQNELNALKDGDWPRWMEGIQEIELGGPARLRAHEDSSGQMVHQAYILKQWEDKAQKRVEDLSSVFEFGGGYGSMARLCYQLGLTGPFVIHDLPEFLLLQEWYLKNAKVTNAIFAQDYVNFAQIRFDLFIAGCSLSEVPFDVRNGVLGTIQADGYVILYQKEYIGRDNHKYFNEFAESRPELAWYNYQVPHWNPHWYLVGVKP